MVAVAASVSQSNANHLGLTLSLFLLRLQSLVSGSTLLCRACLSSSERT